MFLVPVALFLAPDALANGSFAGFVADFVFMPYFQPSFPLRLQNNVCFLRYDVGQYRFGTDQSGDGGAYPGSTQSPTVPS